MSKAKWQCFLLEFFFMLWLQTFTVDFPFHCMTNSWVMAACHGLQSVREALILSFYQNIIDENEFALLYDANKSRELFPYWKFASWKLEFMDDTECRTELRFAKNDLQDLLQALDIPDKIVCSQRTICSGIEGLCILLKRLAYPCRYTDLVPRFGRNPTELCLIFNEVLDLIFDMHGHRLHDWNQPILNQQKLEEYADAVYQRGAPLNNCFGFVDGTLRPVSRPMHGQRLLYNGHKRVHGLKFQSVVIPNGLIANMCGPYEGRKHDSSMLHESNLLTDLRRVAWTNAGDPLCIYGDPAYPLNVHLQTPYRGANLTADMGRYNKAMSEVRVSVEWLFGNISNFFKFIDFKKQLKVGLSAVGKMYLVCALLENARTCLYGNIVSEFFDVTPPTLQEYFQ